MKALVYIAGWMLWPLIFGAVSGRLLGLRIGPLRGASCGLVGVGVGALASNYWWSSGDAGHDFLIYVVAALAGTLAAVAALDFLARPVALGQLERSSRSRPRPLRSAQGWARRISRYASVMRIARRHTLLSALAGTSGRADLAQQERLGRDLSAALQEAGGIFVKFGQVLSTRRELLPSAVAAHFEVLQDRVSPIPPSEVDAVLEAELNRPRAEVFERFDGDPLAAASLGQVHRARLRGGAEVVVKVQRPHVADLVERDLDIILRLAGRLEASTSWGRRAGVEELARGFAKNLREELDYRVEARNTTTLAKALRRRDGIRVPEVMDAQSTKRILVLEWLDGVPLREGRSRLAELGVAPTEAARSLLASFLAQVLELGVFNADPHPGNVLILADGTLAQIDFGSVGRLHTTQRLALARLLIAVDRVDPQMLRDALLELTTAKGRPDLDTLDLALGQFMAQRLGPTGPSEAGMFNDLLALLTSFGLAFDPQLAGAFRALMTLEGTLHVLEPSFDFIDETKKLATGVGARVFGPTALAGAIHEDILRLAPILRRLPYRLERITAEMERDEWGINVRLLADERDVRLVTSLVGRCLMAFLSAAIGVVSALLINTNGGPMLSADISLAQGIGYAGLVIATLLGIRVLVRVSRDRVI
jgi:ubiquinone biosynthesis protein